MDVWADSALSMIRAMGTLPIRLNVKHHGQEAAHSCLSSMKKYRQAYSKDLANTLGLEWSKFSTQ